jgi:glycosyltransferase involved in cell wall biosynthesis
VKVICVCNLWPPYIVGGAEKSTPNLFEGIARHGHIVSSVSLGPEGCARKEMLNGVTVYRITSGNGYWFFNGKKRSVMGKALWHLRDVWNTEIGRELRRIFEDNQPDIIHTHNIDGISPVVWSVARRMGIAIVHTAHDYHLLCPKTTLLHGDKTICTNPPLPCRLYRNWYRAKAAMVDAFCAPAQFVIDEHVRAGFRADTCQAVQHGLPNLATASVELVPHSGPVRLLYAGQLEAHKGLRTILDAMKMLGDRDDVILNIAGRGSLDKDISAAAEADRRIKYHGFVQGDLKKVLLNTNDVLVQPSIWYEPGGPTSAVLEAFEHDMTAIVSSIGGLPEGVKDGVTGLLVPPGDAEALAGAIRSLCTDNTLLDKLRAGVREAMPYFSADRMAEDYLLLYEDLLRRKGKSPER